MAKNNANQNTPKDQKQAIAKSSQSKVKRQNIKKKRKWYQHPVLWTLAVFLLLIGSAGGYLHHKYWNTIESAIQNGYTQANKINKDTLNTPPATTIYDQNGRVLKTLNSKANLKVTPKNMNPYLANGFVAVEDKRFWQNPGVDLYGTLRATYAILRHRNLQGGSTITQQLARNKVLKNQSQTISRKISEMVVAQELTKRFSKKEILAGYLNVSYFGHSNTGVASAAKYYFSVDQKKLTPRQAAVIIGLTNNPTLFDPQTNMKASNEKTATVLKVMRQNKVITKKQYRKAIKQKTKLKITPIANSDNYTDNYATSYAMHNAAEALARNDGFQFRYWFKNKQDYDTYHANYNQQIQTELDKLNSGGYQIYTSIDANLQKRVQRAVESQFIGYTAKDSNHKLMPQVAMTVVDNQSHNVVAIVGGRGTKGGDYFNRAYQGYRQPGSTAKPILGYGTWFEKSGRPQSLLSDTQVPQYPNVQDWTGKWSNRDLTAREALVQSLNAPALRAAMMSPITDLTDKLVAMHFSNLDPADKNYIITIGGFTHGVSTTEMANAYSTLANEGVYTPASNVNKIVDANSHKVIYVNDYPRKQVYKPSAAYMNIDMMKSVVGGVTTLNSPHVANNYPHKYQAVKTGSTDDDKDAYFVETNYYYSSAVWVGNDLASTLSQPEHTLAMRVNHAVQTILLANKKPRDFNKPSNVTKSGGAFTVTGKEDTLLSANDVYQSKIKKLHQNSTKSNQNRLTSLEYRIVYGLSKKAEKAREQKVNDAIKNYDLSQFTSADAYQSFQTRLTKMNALNISVKDSSARTSFQRILDDMQTTLSQRYPLLLLDSDNQEQANNQAKIEQAKQKLLAKNQAKIATLKTKLNGAKLAVISAYSSSDTNAQKQAKDNLSNIIAQLNELGEATPNYTIVYSDHTAVLVPGKKPHLTLY